MTNGKSEPRSQDCSALPYVVLGYLVLASCNATSPGTRSWLEQCITARVAYGAYTKVSAMTSESDVEAASVLLLSPQFATNNFLLATL
jgi:hypothetical protein